MNPTDLIDAENLRDDVPLFAPGDTLKVHVRVVEGNKERVQVFQGVVIRRQGSGVRETFTVRKVSYGVGVERTFPVHSRSWLASSRSPAVPFVGPSCTTCAIASARPRRSKKSASDPVPAAGHTSVRRGLAELPLLALIALVVAFVLKSFVAQAFYIPSGSMEPQLHVGDRVLVSKLAYQLHDPNRGDIIVFPSPEDHSVDHSWLPGRVLRGVFEGVGLTQPEEGDSHQARDRLAG